MVRAQTTDSFLWGDSDPTRSKMEPLRGRAAAGEAKLWEGEMGAGRETRRITTVLWSTLSGIETVLICGGVSLHSGVVQPLSSLLLHIHFRDFNPDERVLTLST